jgi:hypothetical protein
MWMCPVRRSSMHTDWVWQWMCALPSGLNFSLDLVKLLSWKPPGLLLSTCSAFWRCNAGFLCTLPVTHASNLRPLKRKKQRTILMLPLAWDMVLLHCWVGPSLYVILKQALRELEGPWWLVPPFKGEYLEWVWTSQMAPISPKGKSLGFPHCWLQVFGSHGIRIKALGLSRPGPFTLDLELRAWTCKF